MALKDEQVKSILGGFGVKRNRKGLIFSDPDYIRETENNMDAHVSKVMPSKVTPENTDKDNSIKRAERAKAAFENNEAKFSAIVGAQRKILILIFNSCQKERSDFSSQLTVEYISKYGEIQHGSIKKSICRLVEKGYIKKGEYKNGRGGWTKYKINHGVFQEILMLQSLGVLYEAAELKKPVEYNDIDKFEIEKNDKDSEYVDSCEWDELDISSLEKYGLTRNHLFQIKNDGKLPSDLVELSIKAFAFDLEVNNKLSTIKDPVRYFMGILRKGNPYAPPSNYETEQDRAMREFTEKQSELNDKRKEIEERAIDLAFNDWIINLDLTEKMKLLPVGVRLSSEMELRTLKSNFIENEWLKIRKGLIS